MKEQTKSALMFVLMLVGRAIGYALIAFSVSFGGIAGVKLSLNHAASNPCAAEAYEPTPLPPPPSTTVPVGDNDRILFGKVREWAREAAERRADERLSDALDEANKLLKDGIPLKGIDVPKTGPVSGILGAKLLSIITNIAKLVIAAVFAALLAAALWMLFKAYWPYIIGIFVLAVIIVVSLFDAVFRRSK